MKIEDLKTYLNVETSEDLFDFPKPIKHQCPLIDEVISELLSNSKSVRDTYINLKDTEEASNYVGDLDWAEYNIRNLESNMEEIRSNIESLRDWGEEWKCLAKELLEEKEDITNNLSSKYHAILSKKPFTINRNKKL